jgi:phage-related protein
MQAVYYRDPDGNEPVSEFIDLLTPVAAQVVVDNQVDRLNMLRTSDPPLPFPYSSQVEGELRELRCHYGKTLYRILYRRSRSLFILLHAFEKRTGAIPEAEKEIARRRWDDYVIRMNTVRRTPPRAAGHDAP